VGRPGPVEDGEKMSFLVENGEKIPEGLFFWKPSQIDSKDKRRT